MRIKKGDKWKAAFTTPDVMIQDSIVFKSRNNFLYWSNTRKLNRVPNTKWSTLYTIPHGPC